MRINIGWIALGIATIAAAVLAVFFTLAYLEARTVTDRGTIESLTFHQYQAIEDFDDAEYTQDDPAQVQRFQALLDEYDVTPGSTVTTVEDECAGGISTTIEIAYAEGDPVEMFLAKCGVPAYDDFNSAAIDLFTQWRLEQNPEG
jgi:hypothetical protein